MNLGGNGQARITPRLVCSATYEYIQYKQVGLGWADDAWEMSVVAYASMPSLINQASQHTVPNDPANWVCVFLQ